MNLQEVFKTHWEKLKLPRENGTYLLAVSGGMDSMALATLFYMSGIPFAIAHCNFSLRGEASDLDEKLVQDWCAERKIVFHNTRFDTAKEAAQRKTGLQETARDLRYEWFRVLAAKHRYCRIVTAHHADDNAETLMINLFRGTGINGLHGIRPDQGGLLRPLLFATRDEIVEYVRDSAMHYREDASNESDVYLRNAIRHRVMPVIKEVFPQAVRQINSSISRVSEAEYFYHKALEKDKKSYSEQRGTDLYLPVRKLINHPAVSTLLFEIMRSFSFTADQIPQVVNLFQSESGHYVVSATHRVIRNRDFLVVTSLPTEETDLILIEQLPAKINLSNCKVSFSVHSDHNNIPSDKNIACIDAQLLEFPILLRRLKTGDYFYPFGMKMKKKKVSRFLIDQKVALHEKENIWVVESAKRIVWVVGMRIDERFRVTGQTEKIVQMKVS